LKGDHGQARAFAAFETTHTAPVVSYDDEIKRRNELRVKGK